MICIPSFLRAIVYLSQVLEAEKHRNLAHNIHDKTHSPHDYAPGWNEVLASVSEAAVKVWAIALTSQSPSHMINFQADKSDVNVGELQSVTVEKLTTQRTEIDGEESTTAHYVRDTVTGPLSGAKAKVEGPMTPSEEDVCCLLPSQSWSLTEDIIFV